MIISEVEQKSPEWLQERLGKITGTLSKKVHGREWKNLIYHMIDDEVNGYIENFGFESDDMAWGNMQEPFARAERERILGVKIQEAGLLINETHDWIAISPDGFYEDEKGIVYEEFKCPTTAKHIEVLDTKVIPSKKDYWEAQCFHAFQIDPRIYRVNFTSFDPRFLPNPIFTISLFRKDHEERIQKEFIKLLEFRQAWREISERVTF